VSPSREDRPYRA